MQTGLDILIANDFEPIEGRTVGLVVNQASIASDIRHAVDIFMDAALRGRISLKALFGPQHGLWGHTQDNMIEWEGGCSSRFHVPIYSLYGEHRRPTEEMMKDIDTVVLDLQDVGAKYYTFIWTLANCMSYCQEHGLELVVLDRPNPIGGVQVEGPFLNDDFRSFVGLFPMAIRHGLTIGEVARWLKKYHYPQTSLLVVKMQGWQREKYFDELDLPWAMPSPNIPVVDSTVVYPGMCLFEATNVSEGRGTTRPFELLGAAWSDGWLLAEALNSHELPGVHFRPLEFQPTFHKFAGEVCSGVCIHVTDRLSYLPFKTAIAIICELYKRWPNEFKWKDPPYEYEYEKMPFDILVGNDWLRQSIESHAPLGEMVGRWQEESDQFESKRQDILIYT